MLAWLSSVRSLPDVKDSLQACCMSVQGQRWTSLCPITVAKSCSARQYLFGSSSTPQDCQAEDVSCRTAVSPLLQAAAVVFAFRGTVLTKRRNFEADLDVWRNANRDLYFAAR